MALELNNIPPDYSSAHGDLIFTVYEPTKAEDPTTYPNYKYVLDVEVGGETTRLKAFPRPDNKRGVFNIGRIVRDYLSLQFNPVAGILAQTFGAGEFYVEAVCKFGEEVAYTTESNLLTDDARKYFNHYNGRITGAQSVLPGYANKPASNRPTRTSVWRDAKNIFIPYFASSDFGSDLEFEVFTYNSAGAELNNSTNAIVVPSYPSLLQFNVSPAALSIEFIPFDLDDVALYIVRINSTLYYFDVVCESIYTPYTLHFLNQFGGFESYTFSKVSRKNIEVEKKDFSQLPYRIDSDGIVSHANSGGVVNETKTTYSSQFKEKLSLTSDFVSDAEYTWLKELIVSPLVYIQEGDNLVPVTISQTSYEEKKYRNDRLTCLQLEVNYGVQLNAQYR